MYAPCLFLTENTRMYEQDSSIQITGSDGESTDYLRQTMLDFCYPVGSIYTTTDPNVNPATMFGGTWVNIKDVFLYAADPANPPAPEKLTGGNVTHTHTTGDHTLTTEQIPSHTHNLDHGNGEPEMYPCAAWWAGEHTHEVKHKGFYNCDSGTSRKPASTGWIEGDPEDTFGTAASAGNHWHYLHGDTRATGGSKAHNHGDTGSASNLPPYLRCYMWKRTD